MNEDIQTTLDLIKSEGLEKNFDMVAIRADIESNNIQGLNDFPRYLWVEIIRESIINGQFTQARMQAEEADLDYDTIYTKVKGEI